VQDPEPVPHSEIVDRPHVGPPELEHQEHLGGPPTDPSHLHQRADDLVVGLRADARQGQRPVDDLRGEVADRRRLRRREPGATQRGIVDREDALGRRRAVEQGFEAAMDRARRGTGELLEADGPRQFGEVRASRASRPDHRGAFDGDDPRERGRPSRELVARDLQLRAVHGTSS